MFDVLYLLEDFRAVVLKQRKFCPQATLGNIQRHFLFVTTGESKPGMLPSIL